MENSPLVSVVITTKNEESNIRNCLDSIKGQTYPSRSIEIIVVDNGSTDRTREISRGYTDRVYTFGPERSAQRNFGVNKAGGRYILYLDADMMLSGNVVSECVEKCEKEGLIALYVPEKIVGRGFWVRVRDFERSFYNATCIDCVRFIERDKFLKAGGFDERLTGPEDWDFDLKLKSFGLAGIIGSPIYHNEGNFIITRYIRKKMYYAGSFKDYIKKWGVSNPAVKKQFSPGYRYFGVFLEDGKWSRFAGHPFLALGVYFLRVLVGASYALSKERR